MKKTELILIFLSLIALSMSLLFIPGADILTIISLGSLSFIYFYFGFALFNGIRFRLIFNKKSYVNISTKRIIASVLSGASLSIITIGILFNLLSLPGATINLMVGVTGVTIATIIGAIKYQKTMSRYYKGLLIRFAIYGVVGLSLLLIPKDSWIDFKYRNYPDYAEALKKATEDPDNQQLWEKVDEEREKRSGSN